MQPFELTAEWTYLRFHGPDALTTPYHGAYGAAHLDRVTSRLAAVLADGCDVYAYFNNDWYGHAVSDATYLRDALADLQP